MCHYKRVVFQCNHSSLGQMTRKCFLQLAYENNECDAPCGKRDNSPIQSIKVQVLCHKCAAKVADQVHKIAAIKQRIAEAKAKLKLHVDDDDKMYANHEIEDEILSPVSLSLPERLGAATSSSSTGSDTQHEKVHEKEEGMSVDVCLLG